MKKKSLIINADDFGYCPKRNKGIVDLFLEKKISNTTLLVNGLFAKEAADLALTHNIPLGLHFNITEGKPVCKLEQVNTLCDSNTGLFLGKFGCRMALESQRIDLKHVQNELNAQIEHFVFLTGMKPLHIDSHQHIHVHPTLVQTFADVLSRNSITSTRLPCEELTDSISFEKKQFYMKIFENCDIAKEIFNSKGIKYPCGFVGLSTMGSLMNIVSLTTALCRAFSNENLVELMVHPGYSSSKNIGGCDISLGPDEFSMSSDRLHELVELSSVEFSDFLKANQIELTSFEKAFDF